MTVERALMMAGAPPQYKVANSLRFRSSASAYLFRASVASPTNNKIFTISAWIKRGAINDSNFNTLFGGYSTQGDTLGFGSGTNNGGDAIQLRDSVVGAYNILTTPVYRDSSAWYHLVVAIDTTQSTANNRVKIYVNGTQVTSFSSSSYPSQNYVFEWNAGSTNSVIGRRNSSSGIWYFDGYMAEANFIDGQALTPSSFGAFDATSGVWQPVKYSGTYGTNGFYLKFSDTTSTTTLCYDYSGNGNNWTPNNISLTSGSTYDSMLDSPTNYDNGGNGVGNYAVLNPLDSASMSLSSANLNVTFSSGSGWNTTRATIYASSGKWYWEITAGTISSGNPIRIGITQSALSPTSYLAADATSFCYANTGEKITNNSALSYGASYVGGDVIGVALDLDAGTLTFYKNGVSQGQAYSGISGSYAAAFSLYVGQTSSATIANFGQRPFAYTPPSGYKSLCTFNLPAGTVTTSGTFTGNASADGPFIWANGVPTAMTINGNSVTFGTHADKTAGGFKVRTSSSSYNASGSNTFSITSNGGVFKNQKAQPNP